MSSVARHLLSSTSYSTASRRRHDLYIVLGLSGWMVNDQHHGRQASSLFPHLLPISSSTYCSVGSSCYPLHCLTTTDARFGTLFLHRVIITFDFNDLAQKTLGICILGILLPFSSFVFLNFRFHYHC